MRNEPLSLPDGERDGFRKNFLLVLIAHLVLIAAAWAANRLFFKSRAPEQITWLDGGGELGSAALPLPDNREASVSVKPPQPEQDILPPLPPEVMPAPKIPDDLAILPKVTPTPTPRPKPTATPTPHPKPATPKPSSEPTPKPKPKATATPAKNVAKLATPKPGAKPATPSITDSNAKPQGAGTGSGIAASGNGNATNAGTKGGPGAAGGSKAAVAAYFKKLEIQFHREWVQPLNVASSSRAVQATARLRASADGTVESLKLVKPTGNAEVDRSIEQALQRMEKIERPPAELLKNGVLDELVEFELEL
jgi:outer membrane biosynthesis protein TonB